MRVVEAFWHCFGFVETSWRIRRLVFRSSTQFFVAVGMEMVQIAFRNISPPRAAFARGLLFVSLIVNVFLASFLLSRSSNCDLLAHPSLSSSGTLHPLLRVAISLPVSVPTLLGMLRDVGSCFGCLLLVTRLLPLLSSSTGNSARVWNALCSRQASESPLSSYSIRTSARLSTPLLMPFRVPD